MICGFFKYNLEKVVLVASFGKFVFFTFIFISTALSGFESHSSVNSNDSQQVEKISCKFYCSEETCSFFYQNPFNDEKEWKKHLAFDHFICVDCSLHLASENGFLKHCENIHHNVYSKNSYLEHVQHYGELSKRLKTFAFLRQQADFQNCCPFKDCKFHYEPLIFPVDLKTHLAVEHYVCWSCYYSKDSSIYSFLTRRELIDHWIAMGDESNKHGLDFCSYCFDDKLISDQEIFVTSSLSRLQLHRSYHPDSEVSSQSTSSWRGSHNRSSSQEKKIKQQDPQVNLCLNSIAQRRAGLLGRNKKKCPVEGCKFYLKSITSRANLKSHLATEHRICGECYLNNKPVVDFVTRRKLIEHFMHNSSPNSLHGVLYCRKCFQNPEVPDLKVFMAAVPAKLQKHDESHS